METKDPRLIVHEVAPPNTETPLELLEAGATPIPRFFTRNNFPVPPEIVPAAWRIEIDGLVARKLVLSYAELAALPRRRLTSVLECTGNGRGRFTDAGGQAEGLPWGEGAIGNAEWEGVPVAEVFALAGVDPRALQAECHGAGLVRGVEVAKLAVDGLFALHMNGEPLPHPHGGPVRLVVPGWGGISWVKWITAMTLIEGESPSPFNQDSYVLWDRGGQARGKATEMPVKSLLTSPRPGARLPAGPTELRGLAWAPGIALAKVEISLDGGTTWQQTEWEGEDQGPYAWRGFRFSAELAAGHRVLASRATDVRGNTQPAAAEWNRKGYLMNAWHRVAVELV